MGSLFCRPATIPAKKALLWGLFWMLVGAILAWYFSVVPTSVVGYTWGRTALYKYVIFGVAIWVAVALPTLLLSMFRNRGVVVSELCGRMLYAHIPATFVMVPAMFSDKIAFSTFMASPFGAQLPALYVAIMSIYMLLLMVWYLCWSYMAFKHSTQFSGWISVMLFGIAEAASYILSKYAIVELMNMGTI